MGEKKLKIFVGIAPSHNRNFEDILSLSNSIKSTNILINPGNYPYSPNVWDEVIKDTTKMGNPTGSLLKNIRFQVDKMRSYKRIINESKRRIPQKKFTLYYCNLEDLLNNYFFFSFRNKLLIEPILVEDGILNYYNYTLNKQRWKTFKLKRLLSFFVGIPYKMVNGQLSGIDMSIVKKQYVKYPSKAMFPEKAVTLPIKPLKFLPENNKILFIGQDVLENILGTVDYTKSFIEIVESIKFVFKGDSKVLYKPHRNGSYEAVVRLLENAFGENFELVLDDTPVEELIANLKPMYIFSFYSTALLNIKMSLPQNSKVQIFSKPLKTTDPIISKLFKESGINVIE